MLDEALARLTAFWEGEFEPRPVQRPRIPIWLAARWPRRRPIRRAARWDGVFPIDLPGPEAVAELVADVAALRAPDAGPFEVVVTHRADEDPAPWAAARARPDPGSCPPTAPAGRGHQPRTPGGRMERATALRDDRQCDLDRRADCRPGPSALCGVEMGL